MTRRSTFTAALFLLLGSIAIPASAVGYPNLGYFGSYQPYGIQNRTSVATPPYFALHPPVYYGNRHTRPYGISPFASLPQVAAPSTYQGRLAPDFVNPPQQNPYCNSCTTGASTHPASKTTRKNGLVRTNPYAEKSHVSLAGTDI